MCVSYFQPLIYAATLIKMWIFWPGCSPNLIVDWLYRFPSLFANSKTEWKFLNLKLGQCFKWWVIHVKGKLTIHCTPFLIKVTNYGSNQKWHLVCYDVKRNKFPKYIGIGSSVISLTSAAAAPAAEVDSLFEQLKILHGQWWTHLFWVESTLGNKHRKKQHLN